MSSVTDQCKFIGQDVLTGLGRIQVLDLAFNSLDAQKEAGHAFIKSQAHEGWIAVGDDYEDGGVSGGNMDRPALKRLLAEDDESKRGA